jgi:hypothetical protein
MIEAVATPTLGWVRARDNLVVTCKVIEAESLHLVQVEVAPPLREYLRLNPRCGPRSRILHLHHLLAFLVFLNFVTCSPIASRHHDSAAVLAKA